MVARPSFAQVMLYEVQVRKKMSQLVNEGSDFANALTTAWRDREVRDKYLITPFSLSRTMAAPPQQKTHGQLQPPPQPWQSNGGKKGKKGKTGKGKGKGKGKLWAQTPDGRQICFAWNNKDESCGGQCGRVHVCRKCLGNHPQPQVRQAWSRRRP